jgi:Flp pilus assembly protein TadB
MIFVALLQLVWIYSGLTFLPIIRQVIFVVGITFGTALIVWSRVQKNREKKQDVVGHSDEPEQLSKTSP